MGKSFLSKKIALKIGSTSPLLLDHQILLNFILFSYYSVDLNFIQDPNLFVSFFYLETVLNIIFISLNISLNFMRI